MAIPAHSGEETSYDANDTFFNWSIVSVAGEFSLDAYRIYTNDGTIDGTGAGPLSQSSVVSAEDAESAAPSTRDINTTGESVADLKDLGGTALNSVFDGGELVVDQNLADGDVPQFSIKSGVGNAELNVGTGAEFEIGSKFTDDTGATGVLEKTGDGVLKLTNEGNDYTGGTVVSAGTLKIASDGVLGAVSGNLTLDGGRLETTSTFSSDRAVTLETGDGEIKTSGSTTLTLNGDVSGAGALTKTGSGILTLSGANSYTGGTTVSAGTLRGDVDGLQGDIVNDAAVEFAQAADGTYNGDMSGTGSLTKTGAGVLTLSGANSYTGGTTVSAGTLRGDVDGLQGDIVNNAAVEFDQAADGSYSGDMSGTGSLTKTGAGVLTLSGANSYTGGTTVSAGKLRGDVDGLQGNIVNNAAVEFDQAADASYADIMSGTGSLTKTGAGVLTLTGANDYSGGTTISAGTLSVASNAALGNASGSLTLNGGTLATTSNVDSSRTVTLGASNGIFDTSSATKLTLSGAVSGAGALTKTGSGVLTLTGANDYSGGTTVSAGTLIGAVGSLQGNIVNDAAVEFAQAANGTYSGDMSGTGSLTKTGAGVLTLSGANSYSGNTVVSQGTLAVSAEASVDGADFVNDSTANISGTLSVADQVQNQGTFNLDGGDVTAVNGFQSTGAINVSGAGSTITGDVSTSGAIASFAIGSDLTVTGDIDHASTRADIKVDTVNKGTMFTFQGVTFNISGDLTNRDRFFVDQNSDVSTIETINVAGAEIDLQLGSTLSASNGFTNAGLLEGVGTVKGGVTSSGVVAPGNSPGTLTVEGDVAFSASNTFEVEIDGRVFDPAGGAGSYDRLVVEDDLATTSTVEGNFTADGAITPVLRGITGAANDDFDPVLGDTFTVVTAETSVAGTFASVTQPTGGLPVNTRFDVLYGANQVDLVLTPDSYALIAANSGYQNMVNVATALDDIRPAAGANPDTSGQALFEQLYPLSSSDLINALAPLSGEIHVFAANDVRDTVNSFASSKYLGGLTSQAEGQHIWLDVSGTRLRYSQDDIASKYESNLGHVWVGYDIDQRDDLRYGLAFGHGKSSVDAELAGDASNSTTMLMAYYTNRTGALSFGAEVGVGYSNFGTERSVTLANGVETATADGDAKVGFANVSAAYHQSFTETLAGKLWADLDLTYVDVNAYTEGGSTFINASASGETYRSGRVTMGYQFNLDVTPELSNSKSEITFGFGVSRDFGDDRRYTRSLSMHDANWDVSTIDSDPNSAFASLGADVNLGDGKRMTVALTGRGNSDYRGVAASLNFSSSW